MRILYFLDNFIIKLNNLIWSFPLLIIIFFICFFMTYVLRFVQLRYFFESLKAVFKSDKTVEVLKNNQLTSFQAFINTLCISTGNGSFIGIPVAIYTGGPGSIFWLGLMSFFAMALRYSEVYLSKHFIGKVKNPIAHGGPMLYLSLLPCGKILPYFFAFFCFFYSLGGSLIQCNSIGVALYNSWNIKKSISAVFVLLFTAYALTGGLVRIVKILEKLVPLKVLVFFVSACIVLIYYASAIPNAFLLIFKSAFNAKAVCGGTFLYALQQSISVGFRRGILIHESGLGTAAISYGTGENKNSVQDGIIAMLSVYVSIYVICLMVALILISSGVWNSGANGVALIIMAYKKVFGAAASWIVTFLVIGFGSSLIISNFFIGKVCWDFLFKKKAFYVYLLLYLAMVVIGVLLKVNIAWSLVDLASSFLFIVNVIGICFFYKILANGLSEYKYKDTNKNK